MRALVVFAVSFAGLVGAQEQCGYVDDYPDTLPTAVSVSSNAVVNGTVEVTMDRDVFSVVVEPYITYTISVESMEASLEDVEVRVQDAGTNLLARYSSTGGGPAAGTLPVSSQLQRLYIDVRSFAERFEGAYRLTLTVQSNSLVDFDADDLPDQFELIYGLSTNSTSPQSIDGGYGDWDGDGMLNIDEMRMGLNPADGTSVFGINDYEAAIDGTADIMWSVLPTGRYYLQESPLVYPPVWSTVSELWHLGPGAAPIQVEFSPLNGDGPRMYRILFDL